MRPGKHIFLIPEIVWQDARKTLWYLLIIMIVCYVILLPLQRCGHGSAVNKLQPPAEAGVLACDIIQACVRNRVSYVIVIMLSVSAKTWGGCVP